MREKCTMIESGCHPRLGLPRLVCRDWYARAAAIISQLDIVGMADDHECDPFTDVQIRS